MRREGKASTVPGANRMLNATLTGPTPKPAPTPTVTPEGTTGLGVPLSPDDPLLPLLMASGLSTPEVNATQVQPGTPLMSTPAPAVPPLVNPRSPYNSIAGGDQLSQLFAQLG